MYKIMDNSSNIDKSIFYRNLIEIFKKRKYSLYVKKSTKFLEYLPNEIHIKFMRALSYRSLFKFDEAIEEFKKILEISDDIHTKMELFKTYYFLNMYEKALEMIEDLYDKYNRTNKLYIMELIMRKQLNKPIYDKHNLGSTYLVKQIMLYSKKKLICKIYDDKVVDYIKKESIPIPENININVLIQKMVYLIDNSKKALVFDAFEVHTFSLSNLGFSNNNVCNYIEAYVIPNTKNIVSIMPTLYPKSNFIYDLNIYRDKIFKEEPKEKVKRISQVDRFKNRYSDRYSDI